MLSPTDKPAHPGPQVWQGHPWMLVKHIQSGCPKLGLPLQWGFQIHIWYLPTDQVRHSPASWARKRKEKKEFTTWHCIKEKEIGMWNIYYPSLLSSLFATEDQQRWGMLVNDFISHSIATTIAPLTWTVIILGGSRGVNNCLTAGETKLFTKLQASHFQQSTFFALASQKYNEFFH